MQTFEKTWTEDQIAVQRGLVAASKMNRVCYEQGRLDCMLGNCSAPRTFIDTSLGVERGYNTTEQLQWDAGWKHELLGVERPFETEDA
jgi:hypothetical protein